MIPFSLIGLAVASSNIGVHFQPQSVFARLEPLAQAAVARGINSLPEGILVALFAWAVLRILPKQNSRTRFAVWFFALLGVIAIPVAESFSFAGFTVFGSTVSSLLASSAGSAHGASFTLPLPTAWAPILFALWLLAASIGLARLATGLWHLAQLRQSCTPVDTATLDPLVRQTLDELAASRSWLGPRPVTLSTSHRVRVPAAFGLWKPLIVLPPRLLSELPPADLAIIVRHEFAHLRRRDDWTNLIQKFVRAVFFFHPAVWWIESRLSVEREMACDEVVVAETDNPTRYASCLVSLLERSLAERGWTMAQAIVHRAREASVRLSHILDKNRPRATGISKPVLGLVGTFTLLCLIVLPQTPQFVAFETAAHASSAAPVESAAYRGTVQTQASSVAVIPADFKISQSAVDDKTPPAAASTRFSARVISASVSSPTRHWTDHRAAARTSATQPLPAATAQIVPGDFFPPVMMFFENARFVGNVPQPGLLIVTQFSAPSSQGSVEIWQITLFAPVWRQAPRPLPARKI